MEEFDLNTDPQKPRLISISSKLSSKSEEEKSKLILLLKEFRDVLHGTIARCLG